jgi:hypothetical protein
MTKPPPNAGYLAFHRPRFEFVVRVLQERAPASARVLDVGRSPLTSMIARALGARVDSLGLEPDEALSTGQHYRFDLNDAQFTDRWRRGLGPYDAVVFAEVLEHLYTAPELVLAFLRELMTPDAVLLVQTPNAVSLRKRVKLTLGQNPFERIRPDRSNPGHFREYTLRELRALLVQAGLRPTAEWQRYYFDARFAHHERGDEPPSRWLGTAKNVVNRWLPASLREGITVLAKK